MMVIDDDVATVEAIRLILTIEGFVVSSATSIPPLKNFSSLKPDLIILDVSINGNGGTILCQKLKGNKRLRSLPIVMMSAGIYGRKIAEECGANDYVEKPFELDNLVKTVQKHLLY